MHFSENPSGEMGGEQQRLRRAVLGCGKGTSDIGFILFGGSYSLFYWYGHVTSNLKCSLGKGDPLWQVILDFTLNFENLAGCTARNSLSISPAWGLDWNFEADVSVNRDDIIDE
jgi:hypothetical protein